MIANGTAPKIVQPEEGATYDPIWKKKEVAQVNTGCGIKGVLVKSFTKLELF